MRAEELKGNLDGMLLAVLSSGPRHGYSVIEALRERSGGKVNLPSGTIYPALHRLEAGGLVRSGWELVGGRRRRVYEITSAGEQALTATRANWRDIIATIRAVVLNEG
ncbi:PadR family transcriptional regulator [Actinokineospora auranticolor]|uniref:DNA-binding PadR family transcriptional regulator n=1 Tax=Actinokineospora auranticolor TaxID=155976 RepID=A0A2S6GF40_9PSEU|nr:PadR family transcriptional regulator [Actinokineospora auranticolor]PPK63848.1 DNA-binding PadR family transcriptional regulator [Actinokineospora auranticolor]